MSQMTRYLFFFFALLPLFVWAQVPTVAPSATYYMTDEKGEVETDIITADGGDAKVLNAPVRIVFNANVGRPLPDGFSNDIHFTWTIKNTKVNKETNETQTTPIVRDQEEFEMEFNESGSYIVELHAIFYDEEGENIIYEYPEDGEKKAITFSISESKLEFPNGISPNGDDKNDVLKPKEGFKSIVSFHAAIFNRWGKKLYSWNDLNGGWDGKYNGKVVKDGVYFLVVSAKGGDGIDYNIKKAINVISGYNNGENENGSEGGNE